VFHGPALPGFFVSAIRHTHPSWLRRGRSGLPLPAVHGHGMDRCEVSVTIPFDSTEPWSGSVIGSKLDTGIEMMTHISLTSLCEDRLAATTALPIALLPIWNQENPIWQQRLEVVSDLEGPHFHARMISLARYAQCLFNLQHNTTRIGMKQHTS
jgi:hypothetical protein